MNKKIWEMLLLKFRNSNKPLNIIKKDGPWSKKRTMKLNSKKLMSINQFKNPEEDIENKKEIPRIYDVDNTMRLQKAERKN